MQNFCPVHIFLQNRKHNSCKTSDRYILSTMRRPLNKMQNFKRRLMQTFSVQTMKSQQLWVDHVTVSQNLLHSCLVLDSWPDISNVFIQKEKISYAMAAASAKLETTCMDG